MLTKCRLDFCHAVPQYRFSVPHGITGIPVAIYECPGCGIYSADQAFDASQYEGDDYYTIQKRNLADIDLEWGYRWRHILSLVARYGKNRTLLDVGAGNGFFVRIARDEYQLRATGVELSRHEVEFAKEYLGVELSNCTPDEIETQFDIVTCFNVLEHVEDPAAFLQQIAARVTPGGIVVLTTPSPLAMQARLSGLKKWKMICPPHHLNIFAKKALLMLCARNGLDILKYETLSSYIRVLRRIEGRGTALRHAASRALAAFGLGADHVVIARRSLNGSATI